MKQHTSRDLGFSPTPTQTGAAMAHAALKFPVGGLSSVADQSVLDFAGFTRQEYADELLVLAFAAAAFAVRTAPLSFELKREVESGLLDFVKASSHGSLAAESFDNAISYYGEAAIDDLGSTNKVGAPSEVEKAFFDRLFRRGPDSSSRAEACTHLCMFVAGNLWTVQLSAATQMLSDAGLIAAQ